MRFGLILPSFSFPDLDYTKAARLRDFAQRAEAQGFEALWVVEHLLTARGLNGTAWLSPLETVAFAAGCTKHIKLATGILIAALRNRLCREGHREPAVSVGRPLRARPRRRLGRA